MPLPDAAPGTVDALTVDFGRLALEHDPLLATELGLHERDTDLPDLSREALDACQRALEDLRRRVEAFEAPDLEASLDRRGLLGILDTHIATFTLGRGVQRNPMGASRMAMGGVLLPLMWTHLPHADRERSVLGRLRGIPHLLAQGRARLEPGEVPPLWARLGEQSARGSVGFLRDTVTEAFPSAEEPARAAADAMAAYADWIGEELVPAAEGSFAFGEEAVTWLLRHAHFIDEGPAEVMARGRELLERGDALLAEAAGGRDWREALAEARSHHPTEDDLLDTYRAELERLREFCFEHDLVSDPDAPAELHGTPEFLRPVMGYAAYLPPAAFEDVLAGKLWITPPADASGLTDHSYGAIQPITAHEGYPGHHLQMTSVARKASATRKMHEGSTLMVEGWGLYVEELMAETGYYTDEGRLLQLSLSQLRAARIVADMGLHTGAMTTDEAVDLLVERTSLTRATAESEVNRYTMSPTQPFTYLYGAEEIRRIRDAYRRRTGATLREFHDALLSYGHLPPALAAEGLLGPDASA